jgi:hypothetical protein
MTAPRAPLCLLPLVVQVEDFAGGFAGLAADNVQMADIDRWLRQPKRSALSGAGVGVILRMCLNLRYHRS